MIYSLLLSFFILFSGSPKTEVSKVSANFCNLTADHVKVSDFSNCGSVTLTIAQDAIKKYRDAKVISFSVVISPKGGAAYIENITGDLISQSALDRINKSKPDDILVLANVKLSTGEMLKGTSYVIVAEN